MSKKKPIVAVVGRPNVGKSTLFNVLAGEMISIVKDTPGVTRDRIYADGTWLDKNVAVVGRPNVGKSTLFNVLAGEMISIVKDTPGVTRDRIYADGTWLDKNFTLIDTGGIEPDSRDIILAQMREQAEIAIATADVIIFIVDVRQGMTDSDSKVADMLRKSRKPVVLAVNKVDSFAKFGNDVYEFYNLGIGDPIPISDSKVADMLRKSRKPVVLAVNKVDSFAKFGNDVYEFYNLGIGDPIPISATSRLGLGELLDAVIAHFPEQDGEEEDDDRPRIAIVGKPNVGKSSIINKLLGENRVIVSDVAGTTRDAVDTEIVDDRPRIAIVGKPNVGKSSIINKLLGENRVIVSDVAGTTRDAVDTEIVHNGIEYVFIDTAGLRRKSKIKEELERYSIIRTVTAVERADVVLVVIDASEGVTEQDAKIAGIAHDRGKGIIVVVNKWDAIEKNDKTIYEYTNKIKTILSFIPYAEYDRCSQ